jgi:hypothetical protein
MKVALPTLLGSMLKARNSASLGTYGPAHRRNLADQPLRHRAASKKPPEVTNPVDQPGHRLGASFGGASRTQVTVSDVDRIAASPVTNFPKHDDIGRLPSIDLRAVESKPVASWTCT